MTSAERVPENARVRHFDELEERTQRVLFDVAHNGASEERIPELADGDVVVFTDYYRVDTE